MPTSTWKGLTPVIHIVDDEESFRVAVRRFLRAAGYEARAYSSGAEFLMSRPGRSPGCVLLDMNLQGPSGLDIQEAMTRENVALPIIFVTGHGDVPATVRAMKAGAVDFLTKPIPNEALLSAVAMALAQDAEARSRRERLREARVLFETLTPRERAVFERVAEGKLNKQIAAEFGTAERTIKAHRAQVMRKMHVDSVAALVRIAIGFKEESTSR